MIDDTQQRRRGSRRPAPLLLPILKSFDAHTNELRELRLGEPRFLANDADTRRPDRNPAWGFPALPQNRAGFSYAAQKLLKHLPLHYRTPFLQPWRAPRSVFGSVSGFVFCISEQQQDHVFPSGPIVDDTSAAPPALRSHPDAHFPDSAAALNDRAEAGVRGDSRLKLPIFVIAQQGRDLPREHRGLDQLHLKELSATGVHAVNLHAVEKLFVDDLAVLDSVEGDFVHGETRVVGFAGDVEFEGDGEMGARDQEAFDIR